MWLLLVALCAVYSELVKAVDPLVDVGYTKYVGTELPNGISQWLGIRYAAPPVGDLRFRAPEDPPVNNSVQIADSHGPVCLSTGASFPSNGFSEDCLFLDVYAPTDATTESLLPVFFSIPGGGLNSLSDANNNGSDLILAADKDMIVVTINYRVGPYGFLASSEIQQNGIINAGFHDQRKALEWVQTHIKKFGGNSRHVVIGGASAGAESVTLQMTAYGGKSTDLFHAVIAESQSFPPTFTVSEAQFQYNALAERTGCLSATDSLQCLRDLDINDLQNNNIAIPFPGRNSTPVFLYNAIVDGDFLPDYPYVLFQQGKFVKVPSVFGDDTNEGTIFTPSDLETSADMNNFLLDNFPRLNSSSLNIIDSLYPKSTQFPSRGEFFSAAALAYGELRYICPGILISGEIRDFGSSQSNWLYHYNVEDPEEVAEGLGVPHTIEAFAIWGLDSRSGTPPASYFTTNAAIIPVIQGYWTSFIRTFNPNTFRTADSPDWEPFGDDLERLLFETNATRMEIVPSDQKERCDFLISIGVELEQ